MQWHISEIKGRNTKRSWRTRVRNFKAIGTLPCLCFSLWFFYILILSTARFLSLSGSQGGMYSLPSSLHDFQLYLACCILALRITGHLSLLIPHTHKRETSVVAQMVKSLPAMQETQVWTLGQEDTLEKGMKPIHLLFSSDLSLIHSRPKKSCIFIFCIYFLFASLIGSGLPWWFSSKEFTCKGEDAGDRSLIPGSGRSPGGQSSNPLQYFFLESPMDRGGWRATVHRVAKSRTWLSDWA